MTLELSEDEQMLLQVTLYEYICARGPAVEAYVDRRYPIAEDYSTDFRAGKRVSVKKSLDLATKLRACLFA